jgi:hypothetical protein
MADETDAREDDETNDRIFQPDIQPTLSDRKDKEFFPWHRPRKHYLRVHQWCAEVRALITKIGYQDGDVVRYLGFPGEDFLDIRVLKGVCERAKVRIRYLGFDSTASYAGREFDFNLSKHEVFQLGCVHEHSRVLKTRLEQIANESSIAYRRTAKFRDFDIINIDLCDSMTSPTGGDYPPYFDAIKKLCDLQVAGRTQPWLLFLTTRAVRDQLDPPTKRKLFECVRANIGEHPDFASELAASLALDDVKIAAEISDQEPLDHGVLVNLFGLSIGKWLLKMMMEATPRLNVRLLKSYSYRVETPEPDMLSLAFLFDPAVARPVDRSGLSAPAPAAPQPSERQLALELLRGVSGILDIDQHLHDNDETHSKMAEKCGDLLTTVHYDKTKYDRWVEKTRWRPG